MEDYKQKYEQALERAKCYKWLRAEMEIVFPELKEDNDKKISKAIFKALSKKDARDVLLANGIKVSDALAWLEKQGEKIDAIENFDTEFERQISHLIASTINKEHEYNEGFVKWTANALLNYAKHEFEKQGEHKCDCKYVGCHVNNVKRWCHKKQSEILYEKCNIKCSEYLKQGERKQNVTDIISDLENYFATTTKEQQEKDWEEIKKWEEKHFNHNKNIEQNPTDKDEPKFKVGDWLVCCNYEPEQIIGIRNNMYEMSNGDIRPINMINNNHNIRLWTIKDAKDGDVLTTKNFIFIFKNIDSNNGVRYYCDYEINEHDEDNQFVIAVPQCVMGRLGNGLSYYSPATKEQCDLLFSKMKEAGYEWDSENKELRKIKERPDFCHHEVDLSDCSEEYRKGYYDGWNNCNQQHSQLKAEQKPAWSEEDDRHLSIAIQYVFEHGYLSTMNWLKSLKERIKGE